MEEFQKALLRAIDRAEQEHGIRQPLLRRNIEKYGAVPAVKDYLRRGRLSDGFEALADQGLLKLSMEALVTSPKFHGLFEDDEVNECFLSLCSKGYY